MLRGQLTYRAPITGDRLIAFSPIRITPTHPAITDIEVAAPKVEDTRAYAVQVAITFAAVQSEEEARLIGWHIAKDALDRIAFDQNVSVDEPVAPSGHLKPIESDGTAGGPGKVFDGATCFMRGCVIIEPDKAGIARLTKKLNARRLKGRTYYPLFRSALKSDNPVEKYLALYRILLLVHDDKQQELDRFLHSEFGDEFKPRPGQKPKPGKPKIKETVFTKLRNQFAHIRKRTRLEETRQQMEQHMDGLIERVKRAIQKKG